MIESVARHGGDIDCCGTWVDARPPDGLSMIGCDAEEIAEDATTFAADFLLP